jgi:endonuclease/exonuclease/phosphatase family metal-dependent hydrolase
MMKVLTYNVHMWEGQDGQMDIARLADVIEHSGATVVSLNEVLHPTYTSIGYSEPLAELAERLGMHWAFGESDRLVQRPGWWGPIGNAVLSRFPIVANSNHHLPRLPMTQERNLLVARMRTGLGRHFTIYSTHLDHAFEGTRLWQLRGIVEKLRREERDPHLLMGDFNTHTPRKSQNHPFVPPVVRWLRNMGYIDAFAHAGVGSSFTLNYRLQILRLDYIFAPEILAQHLVSCYTLSNDTALMASDHLPLVAELDWRF